MNPALLVPAAKQPVAKNAAQAPVSDIQNTLAGMEKTTGVLRELNRQALLRELREEPIRADEERYVEQRETVARSTADAVAAASGVQSAGVTVADATAIVQRVIQAQRLSGDAMVRPEHGIRSIVTADDGSVRVALTSRAGSPGPILSALQGHFANAGLPNANIVLVPPTPISPNIDAGVSTPIEGGSSAIDVQLGRARLPAAVAALRAELQRTRNRPDEKLRIEDCIQAVRVRGARVVLDVEELGGFKRDDVVAWVKSRLRGHGVVVPVAIR